MAQNPYFTSTDEVVRGFYYFDAFAAEVRWFDGERWVDLPVFPNYANYVISRAAGFEPGVLITPFYGYLVLVFSTGTGFFWSRFNFESGTWEDLASQKTFNWDRDPSAVLPFEWRRNLDVTGSASASGNRVELTGASLVKVASPGPGTYLQASVKAKGSVDWAGYEVGGIWFKLAGTDANPPGHTTGYDVSVASDGVWHDVSANVVVPWGPSVTFQCFTADGTGSLEIRNLAWSSLPLGAQIVQFSNAMNYRGGMLSVITGIGTLYLDKDFNLKLTTGKPGDPGLPYIEPLNDRLLGATHDVTAERNGDYPRTAGQRWRIDTTAVTGAGAPYVASPPHIYRDDGRINASIAAGTFKGQVFFVNPAGQLVWQDVKHRTAKPVLDILASVQDLEAGYIYTNARADDSCDFVVDGVRLDAQNDAWRGFGQLPVGMWDSGCRVTILDVPGSDPKLQTLVGRQGMYLGSDAATGHTRHFVADLSGRRTFTHYRDPVTGVWEKLALPSGTKLGFSYGFMGSTDPRMASATLTSMRLFEYGDHLWVLWTFGQAGLSQNAINNDPAQASDDTTNRFSGSTSSPFNVDTPPSMLLKLAIDPVSQAATVVSALNIVAATEDCPGNYHILQETGELILFEDGDALIGEAYDPVINYLLDEASERLLAENGDNLIISEVNDPAYYKPVIISPLVLAAGAGQHVDYAIEATGHTVSYGSSSLPTGLSLNSVSGHITGTMPDGTYATVTISAFDANGASDQAALLILTGA